MRALRTALPGLFALAVIAGMAVTLASLLSTRAVDIGTFRSESHDALSLYLGHGLYHDPAGDGYTGLLYTPLLPGLVALLDHIRLWNGWPVLVSVIATAALGALIAGLAYRAANRRGPWTLAGAAGMGAAAVWLVTTAVGVLYLGWSDELAWSFALGGLVTGAAAHRTRWAAAATVVLLTLGVWSKQTAAAAPVAYALWLLLLTLRGRRSVRFTATLGLALLALNLAVLGTLDLLTGGWESYFNLTLPTRHTRIYGLSRFATDLLDVVSLPALWALAMCAPALRRGRRALRLDDLASLLVVFVVIGLPCAMYFRSKQGGNPNQYFGVIWGLGALAALAWGRARRSGRTLVEDAAVLVALLGAVITTASGGSRFDLHRLRVEYRHSIPAELRILARRTALFHPFYTDLVPGQVYPDAFNAADLLAGGEQPMGLVRALLSRRFGLVATYASTMGAASLAQFDLYASAYGAREANYFWKLDAVIAAGYAPARGLPAGVLQRRSGPNRAASLADCFAPFRLAGAKWTIRAGGGFWCRRGEDRITLGDAQAASSELVSAAAVRAAGTLSVTGGAGARILIRGGASWIVEAVRRAGGWSVLAGRPGGSTPVQTQTGAVLSLDLGGGSGLAVGSDRAQARISIYATPARDVSLDFRAVRLQR